MASKLVYAVVPFTLLGMTLAASGDGAIKQPPEKTTTESIHFAPGGVIRITGSYGDLRIEGWDRPEVEVTVIKTLPYGYVGRRRTAGLRPSPQTSAPIKPVF